MEDWQEREELLIGKDNIFRKIQFDKNGKIEKIRKNYCTRVKIMVLF